VEEEMNIGVFVCHCGTNIGGFVDVPAVVEYAKTLPKVVCAEPNLYTCSSEGLESIKRGIEECHLNRVVVASCTPRTHEPLFRETCEEAGVNKYLFEFANIRDQCSWVHMKEKEKATEKAKDLVRMAVAKAALLEPQKEMTSEVIPSAAVIGGGIAGMTAALSLANRGFEVHLVEKESQLGGILLSLYKLFPTGEDSFESLMPKIDAVNKNEKIKIYTDAVVKEVKGYIGNYEIKIKKREEEREIKVGTIIVATGATELIPHGFYRYDEYDNVITQMELEKMLKEKNVDRFYDSVVMIQCVGARGQYVTYCSKICCMVAIKNAIIIKETCPDADVYILHNDIQTYGAEYEEYYKKARDMGVFFVRYPAERRPEVSKSVDEELHVRVCHERLGIEMDIKADLVVLSTPLVQNPDAENLSRLLKVPLGQDKFFFEAHVKLRPVDFATDGIYLCGTAHGPEDIAGSVAQAYAAASHASIPLEKRFVQAEAITSVVDEERCIGCGVCESVCPYGAIEVVENIAKVTEVKCKGCGCCGSSCIKRAITMRHFSDVQLVAQARASLA
jgi:heterodisulfide reductase subunit A